MDKPRVCFIIPPSPFLLDERVFVSLGILKVAGALEAHGYPVEVLDLSGVENFEDVAWRHARWESTNTYAITATTPQMPAARKVAEAIRCATTGEASLVKLILGGPHITLAAAAMKQEKPGLDGRLHGRGQKAFFDCAKIFDVTVAGDGEDAIVQAVEACELLRSGETFNAGMTGLHLDADDPKAERPLFLSKRRIEELPPPARHLVDLDSYNYTIDGVRATSLVAQLGCPFACSFCGGRASPMLRRARIRSTESVLAEIEHLHVTHGYCGFMFYDDEMNVNKELVTLLRGVIALQKKHSTEFRLRGFVKAELFTREQAEVMHEAGFRWLLTGFEAADPRILDNINKKATVEDNTRCVELAKAAGLKVKALMSIGHAGESPETIAAVKRWLLEVRPEDFDCTIITPYPGSPYYDEAIKAGDTWTYSAPKSGDRLHMDEVDYMQEADYYKGQIGGGYVSHVWTDHIAKNELIDLRDGLERDVRAELNIPFNQSRAAIRYEHSMGAPGPLPPNILRRSA